MGHVINPVLLRLGVVTPWIAASYSRKTNKRIKYTVENFLIYKYIRQFFNQKIYLKILAKIKKRNKKFLKAFFFHNFPYIFSHLSIMRFNSNYQLNLFFFDTTLQHFLNNKHKRFYKKKKKKNVKKTLIKRKRRVVKKKALKKYKSFFKFNGLFYKGTLKNKGIFTKFLIKKFPNSALKKFKREANKRKKFKIKKRYYGYPRSFYHNLYKKKRKKLRLKKYYKIKSKSIKSKRFNVRKLRKLKKIQKYLSNKRYKISYSLLNRAFFSKYHNTINRYNLDSKLIIYKLNNFVFKVMNLKNKFKPYYYKTRNRFKFRNISVIKYDFKEYRMNNIRFLTRKQLKGKKKVFQKLRQKLKVKSFNFLIKRKLRIKFKDKK